MFSYEIKKGYWFYFYWQFPRNVVYRLCYEKLVSKVQFALWNPQSNLSSPNVMNLVWNRCLIKRGVWYVGQYFFFH